MIGRIRRIIIIGLHKLKSNIPLNSQIISKQLLLPNRIIKLSHSKEGLQLHVSIVHWTQLLQIHKLKIRNVEIIIMRDEFGTTCEYVEGQEHLHDQGEAATKEGPVGSAIFIEVQEYAVTKHVLVHYHFCE